MKRRRLLVVSPWLPWPPHAWGAAMRSYQILRHLATQHEVTLLAYAGADDATAIAALSALGIGVRVVPRPDVNLRRKRTAQWRSLLSASSYEIRELRSAEMQRAIDEVLRGARVDAVLVEFSQMARFRFPLGPVLVVDQHNIEFELRRRLCRVEPGLLRKAYSWIEYRKLRRAETSTWNQIDACLVTSGREAALVHARAPRLRTAVVPNGIDVEYLRAGAQPERNAESIVFTGRMNYRPNADAAIFFANQVLPLVRRHRPGARLSCVGQDPPDEVRRLAGPDIEVTGTVDDVRPYLARASVVVAPIRAGSGTRLKILEALAMGKGVVSTSLGCEGLDLEPGRHLLVADDAAGFASQVLRLLDDPALGERLGGAGRSRVEHVYAWPVVLTQLDNLLATILRPGETRTAGLAFASPRS